MWLTEKVSRKKSLEGALRHIQHACKQVANRPERYFSFTYERLGEISGFEPDDWRHDGCVRRQLSTRDSRRWLQDVFMLWWRSDMENHEGLLFTCDPLTGAEWDRDRIADRVHADGVYLQDMCRRAAELRPAHKDHFRKIGDAGRRVQAGAQKLMALGDREVLRLLGVPRSNGDTDP